MATEKILIDLWGVNMEEVDTSDCTSVEDILSAVITYLSEQPTVDAVEVVNGRWEQIQRWTTKAKYRCSVCGREIMSATKVNMEKYPYCHCGAKMSD